MNRNSIDHPPKPSYHSSSNLLSQSLSTFYSNARNSHNAGSSMREQNSPLKSPSPDQVHGNSLTPSRLGCISGCTQIWEINPSHNVMLPCKSETPLTAKPENENFLVTEAISSHSDLKQLSKQIKGLESENKALAEKVKAAESGRRNMLIIEKIKQQYRENISTIKLMVEQQIRQAISIVEETCQALQFKTEEVDRHVYRLEKSVHDVKVSLIMKQDSNNAKNKAKQNILSEKQSSHSSISSEHQYSDVYCVSIPEESIEESKNSLLVSKLSTEIEKLKAILQETQESYDIEKKQLVAAVSEKSERARVLEEQLSAERAGGKLMISQSELQQELRIIQKAMNELAEQSECQNSRYDEILLELEDKTIKLEIAQQDNLMLRDKFVDLQKAKILLEQKVSYCEGNLQIYESELNDRKRMLNEVLEARELQERERIKRNRSALFDRSKGKSVLQATARIDKLLLMEQAENENRRTTPMEKIRESHKLQPSPGFTEGVNNSRNPSTKSQQDDKEAIRWPNEQESTMQYEDSTVNDGHFQGTGDNTNGRDEIDGY